MESLPETKNLHTVFTSVEQRFFDIIRDISVKHFEGKKNIIRLDEQTRKKMLEIIETNEGKTISMLKEIGYPNPTSNVFSPFDRLVAMIRGHPYIYSHQCDIAGVKILIIEYYDHLLIKNNTFIKKMIIGGTLCEVKTDWPNNKITVNPANGCERILKCKTPWSYSILRYKLN